MEPTTNYFKNIQGKSSCSKETILCIQAVRAPQTSSEYHTSPDLGMISHNLTLPCMHTPHRTNVHVMVLISILNRLDVKPGSYSVLSILYASLCLPLSSSAFFICSKNLATNALEFRRRKTEEDGRRIAHVEYLNKVLRGSGLHTQQNLNLAFIHLYGLHEAVKQNYLRQVAGGGGS